MASILSGATAQNEYEVLTAASGYEALRQVLRHDFAVILLDVKMPGMDGFETAEAIHLHPSSARVPIIFITAHFADEMRRLEGYETGAVDYLLTPVVPKILCAKVSVFVQLAKQRMELQEKTRELASLNSTLQMQRLQDLERANAQLQAEIIERKKAEQQAQELATKDPLTGLLNRRSLTEHLERAIIHAERHQEPLALLFLDLDKFKLINDSFGHQVGDELLVQVADRLSSSVRKSDLVARLGGDEFIVLIEGCKTPDVAQQVANKITDAIAAPCQIGGQTLCTATSIGIAMYPRDGQSADILMKCADTAMYAAKQQRRRTPEDYAPAPRIIDLLRDAVPSSVKG